MAWVAVIGAVGTVGGAMIGRRKGATDQVQSNAKSMDPRVDAMYFGQGGLLSDLNDWYAKNKTGINPDMQAGLDHMRSVYQSPLATQGYERMGNVGYNLMGQGVAGNPFVTGNMPNFGNLQQPGYQLPQAPQQSAQPAQLTQNLGLSNGWATQAAPVAPAAPVTPAAPTMDADQFRKLYEEEMKRRDAAWWADASNNPTAGHGA